MDYLLYLVMGEEWYFAQAACSIHSFRRCSGRATIDGTRVVVFTDNVELLQRVLPGDLNLTLQAIPSVERFQTIMSNQLLHRFVTEHDGRTLLVDTDTFFIRDPAPLFESIGPASFVLHLRERDLREPTSHFSTLLARSAAEGLDVGGNTYALTASTSVWNAGVIGVHHTHASLLADAVELNARFDRYSKHWANDQLALFVVFASRGSIHPADSCVIHYWFLKDFGYVLADYFALPALHQNDLCVYLHSMMDHPDRMRKEDMLAILADIRRSTDMRDLPPLMIKLGGLMLAGETIDLSTFIPRDTYIGDLAYDYFASRSRSTP